MYTVVDASYYEDDQFGEAYDAVHSMFDKPDDLGVTHRWNKPSNFKNIRSHLFAVHPIKNGSLSDDDYLRPKYFENGCGSCFEDFGEGELVMSLHCDHMFHVSCVFSDWDHIGRSSLSSVVSGQVAYAIQGTIVTNARLAEQNLASGRT